MKNKLPGFVRPRQAFSHELALERLKNLGFVPATIYDIGAFQGEWTKTARKVFSTANYLLFEANSHNANVLEMKGERYTIAVLAAVDGEERPLYLPRDAVATGVSLYREQTEHYSAGLLRVEVVKTRRLDVLAAEQKLPDPDLIKLDVQGAELDVLAGAGKLLDACSAIIAETSLLSYNEGAPLMGDVVSGFAQRRFRCVDICEVHRAPTGNTLQMDMLFVNELLYEKYRIAASLL